MIKIWHWDSIQHEVHFDDTQTQTNVGEVMHAHAAKDILHRVVEPVDVDEEDQDAAETRYHNSQDMHASLR